MVFQKDLEVYHKVYPNRLTMIYLMRRAWYESISECIMYPTSEYLRKTLGCFRRMLYYLVRMLMDNKNMRYYLVKIVAQIGFLYGIFINKSLKNGE